MSIDYDANSGIGYEVLDPDWFNEDHEYYEEGFYEFLESKLGDGFSAFQVGCSLSGEFENNRIIVDKPFNDGLDMTAVKGRLDAELKRLNLEPDGEFGVVGGLLVW